MYNQTKTDQSMKKILLTLTLALTASLWAVAETVDEFIATMKRDPMVECVELTPDLLKGMMQQQMAQRGASKDDADLNKLSKVLKEVRGISVLEGKLPEDRGEIDKFKVRLAALTVDGLDEMVNTNEDGELTRVWMQVEGDKCTMILVVNADEADHDWQVVKLHSNITIDENFNLNDLIH